MAQKGQVVPYEVYQKLEARLKRKEEEIKEYKKTLTNTQASISILEENLRSSKTMFFNITKQYEEIRAELSKRETRPEIKDQYFNSAKSTSGIRNQEIKDFFSKRLEELEQLNHDLANNMTLLVSKYILLKNENTALNDELEKSYQDIRKSALKLKQKTDDLTQTNAELKKHKHLIDRFREIDCCLLETVMKTCYLNTKKSVGDQSAKDYPSISAATHQNMGVKGLENASYIMCEPVPSFVRFVTNASKKAQ